MIVLKDGKKTEVEFDYERNGWGPLITGTRVVLVPIEGGFRVHLKHSGSMNSDIGIIGGEVLNWSETEYNWIHFDVLTEETDDRIRDILNKATEGT